MRYAHRVIMEFKLKRKLAREETVMHTICDNPPCCNPNHLKVGTLVENNKERDAKGRTVQGARHHRSGSKLNELDVLHIRLAMTQHRSLYKLAEQYGVCITTIKNIRDWKTWKHVELPERKTA
jgi:hypothetical protein